MFSQYKGKNVKPLLYMCCLFVQLSAIQHNLQMKEKEYEAKLQTLEDGHRERMNEMREMLTAQQRMTAK